MTSLSLGLFFSFVLQPASSRCAGSCLLNLDEITNAIWQGDWISGNCNVEEIEFGSFCCRLWT